MNEGRGKVLRMGAYSPEVLAKLQMDERGARSHPQGRLEAMGGVDIRTLLAKALHMGDDGHNRLDAASILYTTQLAPYHRQDGQGYPDTPRSDQIPGRECPQHPQPGHGRLQDHDAMPVHNVEGSTIVTVMARNGTDFGIRVSGLGDRWFTGPAGNVKALYFPGFTEKDANPDIGDSTITETAGIGGFAMAGAPAIVTFISGTPKDAINTTLDMYEITYGEA